MKIAGYPLPPYATALNISILENGTDESGETPLLTMPFTDKVQGRPGFLHGGAISGLLEMAAIAAIHNALIRDGRDAPIRQVNVTVDFMRGGLTETSFAQGTVTRLGRTMANVSARVWQDDSDRTVAQGHMHYLIGNQGSGAS